MTTVARPLVSGTPGCNRTEVGAESRDTPASCIPGAGVAKGVGVAVGGGDGAGEGVGVGDTVGPLVGPGVGVSVGVATWPQVQNLPRESRQTRRTRRAGGFR